MFGRRSRTHPISQERQRLLETVEEQIRDTIPDLAGRLDQPKERTMEMEGYQGMRPKM